MPPTSEPTPEPTAVPEPEGEPKGEPKPKWTVAKETWGAAWPCHWIGFAVIFALMSLVAIILLRRLLKTKAKRRTMAKFTITITAIITTFMISRFLYMIINPYESPSECLFGKGNCPLFLSRFLLSVGVPSLVSAFMLLHLALLDVMKFQKLNNFTKLQNWWFLIGLVSINYIISITADLTVAYKAASHVFLAVCQGYFILFSLGLVVAFSYTGLSIYLLNRNTKSQVYQLSTRHGRPSCSAESKHEKKATRKVVRLTTMVFISGLIYLFSQVYALVMAYVNRADAEDNPKPWPWLICQYLYRFIELLLACCLLFNISYMPKKNRKDETTNDRECTNSNNSKMRKMENSCTQ